MAKAGDVVIAFIFAILIYNIFNIYTGKQITEQKITQCNNFKTAAEVGECLSKIK